VSETITYQFTDSDGDTDTVILTVDTSGRGPGYAVTGVSGTIDGVAIDGELGNQGQAAISPDGAFLYNNTFFLSDGAGVDGSVDGIDNDGLLFTINGVEYNLFSQDGSLVLYNDANGYSSVGLTPDSMEVTCFCQGTLISTVSGDVPVEKLAVGDLVLTPSGEVFPIRWIGCRAVATWFVNKLTVMPVRIKANALGEAVPRRDLLVSPDHAMLVDGILVHAGALVNGISIVRETDMGNRFSYYHVELADHALILAENAPAETFIDNADRMTFDNWAEHEALYGETATIAEMAYPRAKAQRQVPAATRTRLLDRGLAMHGQGVTVAA
jgi:Hint domain